MDQVLFDSNQILFTIWNYLEIQTLLTSCITVHRAWTLHLWPLPDNQHSNRHKLTLSNVYNDHYATSAKSNYFFRRTVWNITRLPSLRQLENSRTLQQLCQSLPNLVQINFQSLLCHNWFQDSELSDGFDHLWFTLFKYCSSLRQFNFPELSIHHVLLILHSLNDSCIALQSQKQFAIGITQFEHSRLSLDIIPREHITSFIISEITVSLHSIHSQQLYVHPGCRVAKSCVVQFDGEFIFDCFFNPGSQHGWCEWEIHRFRLDCTEHLTWHYTGTLPVLFTIKRTMQEFKFTHIIPNTAGLRVHMSRPFQDGCLPQLKRFTLSRAIDDGLKAMGCTTMTEILSVTRPEIVVHYL